MESLDPFQSQFWILIGYVFFCGGLVGIERQLRGKPAGVRTSILIVLGTSIFVRLGTQTAEAGGDHTRVMGQVVTGVGFLGAGVIMNQNGAVTGVTTAAVIWVLAAMGASIGAGVPNSAAALAIVTVFVVTGMEFLESTVRWFGEGVHDKTRELLGGDESPGAARPQNAFSRLAGTQRFPALGPEPRPESPDAVTDRPSGPGRQD